MNILNNTGIKRGINMEKIFRAKISLPFKWIAITAYAILTIPTLIFLLGWLKWYWGILFSAVLLVGTIWVIHKDYWQNKDTIDVPLIHLVLITAALGLWILYSGSCGVGVSNYDTKWRTATLRDLIDFEWPVYYPETDSGLCYYFIFWMIPAVAGKLLGIHAAFLVQWIWMLLIVIISFLLISYLLKDYRTQVFWLICSFIILWSGINILGTILTDIMGWNLYGLQMGLNEAYCNYFFNGESFNFYYRSNQDFISETYNQIIIWVAVPLYLQNRQIHNFAFLGLLLFPFSPWGTIGLGILMVLDAIHYIMRNPLKAFVKEVFSLQNFIAIFSIITIFGCFFLANSRTDSGQGTEGGAGIITLSKFDAPHIIGLIVFWGCEFGIYFIFMWKKYKKDWCFRVLLPILMLIPFFWIGNIWGRDFCMNVSLPALCILMIYMISYIKDEILGKKLTGKHFVLLVCLIMAATTPVFDWAAKTKIMVAQKSIIVQDDSFYTYSNKIPETVANQVAAHPYEAPFYKYFAKPIEKSAFVSDGLSEIKSINDIDCYFDYLADKDCTIYIAVQDIQGFSLRQDTVDRMKQLGFNNEIDLLMQREYHSFIGITENGRIMMQQLGGDEAISDSTEIDKCPVTLASATFNTGNSSQIVIKGRDYSVKSRGLNIAVKDNITGCIVDSVCFDTHVDGMTCTR